MARLVILGRHRQHGGNRSAAAEIGERLGWGGVDAQIGGSAEMFARQRFVAAGMRLTRGGGVGDGDHIGALHRRGGSEQFSPDARQHTARQVAFMAGEQTVNNLRLPPWAKCHAPLCPQRANTLHHCGALHKQIVHRIIKPVQLGTQGGEGLREIGRIGNLVGHAGFLAKQTVGNSRSKQRCKADAHWNSAHAWPHAGGAVATPSIAAYERDIWIRPTPPALPTKAPSLPTG